MERRSGEEHWAMSWASSRDGMSRCSSASWKIRMQFLGRGRDLRGELICPLFIRKNGSKP